MNNTAERAEPLQLPNHNLQENNPKNLLHLLFYFWGFVVMKLILYTNSKMHVPLRCMQSCKKRVIKTIVATIFFRSKLGSSSKELVNQFHITDHILLILKKKVICKLDYDRLLLSSWCITFELNSRKFHSKIGLFWTLEPALTAFSCSLLVHSYFK